MTVVLLVLVAVIVLVFGAFTGRDRTVLFGRASSIEVDGLTRTYRVVPSSASTPPDARRLVIALHGYTGNGRQFAYYTALHNALGSDTVVAYPDAVKTTPRGDKPGWNAQFCCGSGWKTGSDDVTFIRVLIEDLRTKYHIDRRRVFLVGFSNGAFMVHRFTTTYPDMVAGAAAISGTIGTRGNSLNPTEPVPMLLTHGMKDVRVRYDGGESPGDPEFDWLNFATTVESWKVANLCDDELAELVTTSHQATTTYHQCAAPLKTIEYFNNGHVWDGWRLGNVWHRRPRASIEIARFFDTLSPTKTH